MINLDKNILINICKYIEIDIELLNIISLYPSLECFIWKNKCIDKFLSYNNFLHQNKFDFLQDFSKDYYNSFIKIPNNCFFPFINSYEYIKIDNDIFYFTENFENGNRCIRGNVPYFLSKNPYCSFLKINNKMTLLPLLVYYYEIFIFDSEEKYDNSCISIGICSDNFPLVGLQLGWDNYSYGLHSDNGKIYFNNISENFTEPFHSGNYIGCGLFFNGVDYDLFYTKNGNFLGYAFKNIIGERFYPSVGVDCKNKIKINFGLNNFQFDFMKINNLAIENYKMCKKSNIIHLNTFPFSFHIEENKYKLLNNFLNKHNTQINNIIKSDFENIILNIILSLDSHFDIMKSNIPLIKFLEGPIYLYDNTEELETEYQQLDNLFGLLLFSQSMFFMICLFSSLFIITFPIILNFFC